MDAIRVLIVAEEEEGQQIRDALKSEEIVTTGVVFDENMVLDMITRTGAQLVILADDQSGRFFRCCQQIYMLRPRTVPVILTGDQSPENYRKILQTGCHYILSYSMEDAQLVQSVKGISMNESTRMISLENTSGKQAKSKIVAVYGAKDGVGKTDFAVNMAVILAQAGQKVAYLDLNLQFGDANVFFGIEPKLTISELLEAASAPGIDQIRKHLQIHETGVNLLCAPKSPELATGISAEQIEQLLAAIRSYYDYIFIDMVPVFDDINLVCLDAAASIFYITGGDMSAVRNSKKGLYFLSSLVRKEKIHLILGKEREGDIDRSLVEKTLDYPIFGAVPYDYKTLVTSLNIGKPAVLYAPGSKFSKSVKDIAAAFLDMPEAGGPKKRRRKMR